jgi:hypothetical protein
MRANNEAEQQSGQNRDTFNQVHCKANGHVVSTPYLRVAAEPYFCMSLAKIPTMCAKNVAPTAITSVAIPRQGRTLLFFFQLKLSMSEVSSGLT